MTDFELRWFCRFLDALDELRYASEAMTERASDQERRESGRVGVDLWVEERTGDATYFQRATNLSQGGLFLHGTLAHPPGTRVSLDLHLPDSGDPIGVRGEVVAVPLSERGMGIRFIGLTPAASRRIAGLCRPARAGSAPIPASSRVA
jgi:uncharacterized protein (TIGR02266 family)